MKLILAVAMGGAMGAVGRYLVTGRVDHWLGAGFPYGTLTVNILGSMVLGALIEVMALFWSPSQEVRALVVVGVLGSFTTFSTFSLDVIYLAERGETLSATVYVAASVVASVGGLLLAMRLTRHLLM